MPQKNMGDAGHGAEFHAAIVSVEKIYRNMAILTHHVRYAPGHRDDLPVVEGHKIF